MWIIAKKKTPPSAKRDNKTILTFHILVTLWIHAEQKRMDFLKLHWVLCQCWMPNDEDNVLADVHNHHMAHIGRERCHVNGGMSSDLEKKKRPTFQKHDIWESRKQSLLQGKNIHLINQFLIPVTNATSNGYGVWPVLEVVLLNLFKNYL